MKKTIILVLGAVLLLASVLPVLASDNGNDAVVKAYTQRLEAQKDYLDALAKAGQLTKEQADLAKQNIDLRIEYINSDDFDASTMFGPAWGARRGGRFSGPMMGGFGGRMMGGFGGGMMGGFCGAYPRGYAPAPAPAQ